MINEVRLRWYDEVSVDTKSYQQALDAEIKILKDRRRALFAEETRSREGLLRWQQQQPFPPQATGFNFTQSCNDYYGIASDYQGQMQIMIAWIRRQHVLVHLLTRRAYFLVSILNTRAPS